MAGPGSTTRSSRSAGWDDADQVASTPVVEDEPHTADLLIDRAPAGADPAAPSSGRIPISTRRYEELSVRRGTAVRGPRTQTSSSPRWFSS